MKNAWLKGLLVALAGGAVIGATHALTADKVTAKGTGSAAAMGALSVLGAYLAQSPVAPVPPPDKV